MATARAKRVDTTEEKVFRIDMSVVLPRLVNPNHIQAGDKWFFSVEDTELVITRSRQTRQNIDED